MMNKFPYLNHRGTLQRSHYTKSGYGMFAAIFSNNRKPLSVRSVSPQPVTPSVTIHYLPFPPGEPPQRVIFSLSFTHPLTGPWAKTDLGRFCSMVTIGKASEPKPKACMGGERTEQRDKPRGGERGMVSGVKKRLQKTGSAIVRKVVVVLVRLPYRRLYNRVLSIVET